MIAPFTRVRCIAPAVAALAVGSISCAGHLSPKADVFSSHQAAVTLAGAPVTLTLVKPVAPNPPPFLVVFASGDGGLMGVSKALLQHLADRGNWVVGFSSPDAFEGVLSQTGEKFNYAAGRDAFTSIVSEAKRGLNLPAETPIIVTGMSRGANVVVASAGDPTLRPGIIGAVAIALTREFDNLTVPDEAKDRPGVEADEQGRLQTYPALRRLGRLPVAIIQSTNDSYVTSAESRRLLGPDTPTRRLYEVPSSNHSFGGGRDALMRDFDDAMKWIASSRIP